MYDAKQITLSDEQAKVFENRAKALGMSLSDYVEQIIVNGCEPKAKQTHIGIRIDEPLKRQWKEYANRCGFNSLSGMIKSVVNDAVREGER